MFLLGIMYVYAIMRCNVHCTTPKKDWKFQAQTLSKNSIEHMGVTHICSIEFSETINAFLMVIVFYFHLDNAKTFETFCVHSSANFEPIKLFELFFGHFAYDKAGCLSLWGC